MESLGSQKNLKSDQSEAPEPPRPAPSAERTLHETLHETSTLQEIDRHVAINERPEERSGEHEDKKGSKNTKRGANAWEPEVGQQAGQWELPPPKEEAWTTIPSKKHSRTNNTKKTADSEGVKAGKKGQEKGQAAEMSKQRGKTQERCRAFIRGFCQFGNKCWHSHEKPSTTKTETVGSKPKRFQTKLFDWNKELKKVLTQDPPAKHTPKTDLFQRYQAIAMQPSIDLETKINLTEEQNAIVEAWFTGQIILEQPPYFLNQCYDVYQIAHIQAAFAKSTQGQLRMPLQASMRVSPGLLHHAILNSMKLPESTETEQKTDLARFKDSVATSYVDHETNTIFFQTHNKAAAEMWHGRYMPFQNRPTRLWNTAQGDPTVKYQDVEDQESRQYHVKLVEVTANITPKHQIAMWEHLDIKIQTMTSRGAKKTRYTEASTVKVMFPTAFVPDKLKKITCLEWLETRGPTPARRRIYIEHYQLEKGNICPICLHAGHNMMTCRDEEDQTKKITLPNDFFNAMKMDEDLPNNWQAIMKLYQEQKKVRLDAANAQIKATEEATAKAHRLTAKLESEKAKVESEKAEQALAAWKKSETQKKKTLTTTPSPIPSIKLRQHSSQGNEDVTMDDLCEYSHTSPPTNTEFHQEGPIDDLLKDSGRYVAKTVENGTCFSAAIMIAWRNQPLENPYKFTGAELDEIRAVDQARMEAWENATNWKDLYKHAPFVPKDSSPDKIYRLTKKFFKTIIKPLATAGRKPQHYGSEADIYTASLAIGTPIYLFERHTTTMQPTQQYWTLSEYNCDAEDKTCYVLNRNKWKAILDSNKNHIIRYINNNHYEAIPQKDTHSNEDTAAKRAAFLEAITTVEPRLLDEEDFQTQNEQPKTATELTVKPAKQSSIQSYFSIVPAPNLFAAQIHGEVQATDDMECIPLEAEKKRKRDQRDQDHDSADDKQEKISKATTPSNNPDKAAAAMAVVEMEEATSEDPITRSPRNTQLCLEDLQKSNSHNEMISDHLGYIGTQKLAPSQEEIPTQYTDTLTWDNEQLHNDWTEEQIQYRHQQFEAVSEARIRATQQQLKCSKQEAINDIFLTIHNEVMMQDSSEQQQFQLSQMEDSDYIPSEQDPTQTNTQSSGSSNQNSQDDKTTREDREATLLIDIQWFQNSRIGITKNTPSNVAQVDGWCKKNITHLEELIQKTDEVGALLNLLSPETLDEYGQRLIVDATTVWLAQATNGKADARLESWYMELSNEQINTKMRHARATSRTAWESHAWDSQQEIVNAWIRIQSHKKIKLAILSTLPAIMATGKRNMLKWMVDHAKNPQLMKLFVNTDWAAIAGITPTQWQSLLKC